MENVNNDLSEQMYGGLTATQMSIVPTFKTRMKYAAEQGLLLFIKYGLVLILAYFALTFGTNVVSGAANGTQAILYLVELQNKGYLPKVNNGVIPEKTNETTPVK